MEIEPETETWPIGGKFWELKMETEHRAELDDKPTHVASRRNSRTRYWVTALQTNPMTCLRNQAQTDGSQARQGKIFSDLDLEMRTLDCWESRLCEATISRYHFGSGDALISKTAAIYDYEADDASDAMDLTDDCNS